LDKIDLTNVLISISLFEIEISVTKLVVIVSNTDFIRRVDPKSCLFYFINEHQCSAYSSSKSNPTKSSLTGVEEISWTPLGPFFLSTMKIKKNFIVGKMSQGVII